MRGRRTLCSLSHLPEPERHLSIHDPVLFKLIAEQESRWPSQPDENAIWGLIRIVMAQQVSTLVAWQLANRAKAIFPSLLDPCPTLAPDPVRLRAIGLSQRRAQCCHEIVSRASEILAGVSEGKTWEEVLDGVKGIGPWTIAVFKIMVLRHPDILPIGDVGLERAITNIYGKSVYVEQLGEKWKPFRSVACWYLWRTLGNLQLG
jgi:DNA-3-methyladenine glycosylase II